MGAHIEALDEGVLLVLLDPRYTQVGFNLMSVQVCTASNANQSLGLKSTMKEIQRERFD